MSRATQDTATVHYASDTQLSCSMAALSRAFSSHNFVRYRGPTTPHMPGHGWFGLFPVRSPLLGESLLFSFPAGTKMFQFPAFASITKWMIPLQGTGLSHSEIRASKVICTYTRLIAAYHVLHRLREPRHPPCALSYFLAGMAPLLQHHAEYTFVCTSTRTCLIFVLSQHVKERYVQLRTRVENNGFEPLTPCVQGRCSSQLS